MKKKSQNAGNRTEITEMPIVPIPEIAPPGVIVTPEEVQREGVSDADVNNMRDWNMENKL